MDRLGRLTWELELGYRLRRLADPLARRLLRWMYSPGLNLVTLETTTSCTRKCVYCPPHYNLDIPPLAMEWETYRRVVDSLAANAYRGNIAFNLYGDSLLDEKLEDRIRYAAEKSPLLHPIVYTNGDKLTVERFLGLKEAGMDLMMLSQHSPELGGELRQTLETLKRDHPGLYDLHILDIHKFYHEDGNRLGFLNNRGGLADVKRKPISLCRDLECAAIDCLGNVILCCQDCTSSYVFGNVLERDFWQIWNDPAFAAVRARIRKGEWLFEICRKCAGGEGLSTAKPEGKARRLAPAFHDFAEVMASLSRPG